MPETATIDTETESSFTDDPRMADLEKLITADEAELDARIAAKPSPSDASNSRNARGQFVSATNGHRAGQDRPTGDGATNGTPAQPPGEASPKPDAQAADGQAQQNGKPDSTEEDGSKFRKSQDRANRSWKQINEDKVKLEADRVALDAERKQWEAQRAQAASSPQAGQNGAAAQAAPRYFSAAELDASAAEFDARGQFDTADKVRAESDRIRAGGAPMLKKSAPAQPAAATAQQAAPVRNDAATRESWGKVSAEIPEAVTPGSAINQALISFIRGNPEVMQHPNGPYLAADYVRAKAMSASVPKLTAEAARVPELTKQVETLTAKVRDLEKLTELPGGGSPPNRGTAEIRPFSELSTADQERQLDSELLWNRG
jgi:hypothetical protein